MQLRPTLSRRKPQRFRWRPWIGLLFLRFVLSAGLSYVLGGLGRAVGYLRGSGSVSAAGAFAAADAVGCRNRMYVGIRIRGDVCGVPSAFSPGAAVASQFSKRCPGECGLHCGRYFYFYCPWGHYIVRGILRKAGTLPSQRKSWAAEVASVDLAATESQEPPLDFAVESADEEKVTVADIEMNVDVEELNRGRLIGNLERIVLTIVVAAGSYSALGFLIAAKGLVRFEEFEKSREFTEYFLVGSLSSVLVALCAGLILRHALLMLLAGTAGIPDAILKARGGQEMQGTGAPGEIRTPDLQLRRLPLYPAELRARDLQFTSGLRCHQMRQDSRKALDANRETGVSGQQNYQRPRPPPPPLRSRPRPPHHRRRPAAFRLWTRFVHV